MELNRQAEAESKKNAHKLEQATVVQEVKPSDISLEDDDADVLNMKRDAEGRSLPKKPRKDAQEDTRMMNKPAARPQQPKIILGDGRKTKVK